MLIVTVYEGCVAHRLASTVLAHDESERLVKLNHVLVIRAETPDPLDQHFINGTRHGCTSPAHISSPAIISGTTRAFLEKPSMPGSNGIWIRESQPHGMPHITPHVRNELTGKNEI